MFEMKTYRGSFMGTNEEGGLFYKRPLVFLDLVQQNLFKDVIKIVMRQSSMVIVGECYLVHKSFAWTVYTVIFFLHGQQL